MFSRELLASLALSFGLTSARVANFTRATSSSLGQFYAYGTDIPGLPLFCGDGIAYIGTQSPPRVANATNVTRE